MDREADDYPLFPLLTEGNHRFVIRSMHDRLLLEQLDGFEKLHHVVSVIEEVGSREVQLSKRKAATAPKKAGDSSA